MPAPSKETRSATWDDDALRAPHAVADKAERVEAMFDAIAPTYERVNTLATFGRDAAWRRRAVRAADVRPDDVVLDVCCGTGDMIRAFARARPSPAQIIGVDFSAEMLRRGRYVGVETPIELLRGDALELPLRDDSVDVASCAFGVRNFARLDAGLAEIGRVLRPGGRVAILEFAAPTSLLLARLTRIYCDAVLPRLGAWISRDRTGAYRYLPRSIQTFETVASMQQRLRDAGFVEVSAATMNFGLVALYSGRRAAYSEKRAAGGDAGDGARGA